ncbi:hypothetical protein [Lutibacter sp.]|uniref:hypothetical protein n=1 Tax=Lutibacter sp. TaxID=1925666 RepID=UPI0025C106BE|nr:hypothetical protein [Lutibacter sp.]MCF6168845.1 hypothetical protein [Lutibacter sp.]
MKKQFLNLGKALSKAEQRGISGGEVLTREGGECAAGASCEEDMDCTNIGIQCQVCVSGGCQMS